MPDPTYTERRVRVSDYGVLPMSSPLLVRVPSIAGATCRLHTLAATSLVRMSAAVERDLGFPLLIASGWRAHRWDSWAQYEAAMVERYGSVAEGRRFVAYNSPHETGLAMDLECGGLEPQRASIPTQRETPLHAWLVAHACEYGWHPYKTEPWHWEYPVPPDEWRTGVVTVGG